MPGAPTIVSADPGDGVVDVSWTAPASDGGDPISAYTVTATDGVDSFSCGWTSGPLTCQVSGLTNGTQYTLSVTASNGIGEGPASTPVTATPVAPATVPGAPTIVSAVPGDGVVDVSWTAPASDGGDPISAYTVTATDGVDSFSCGWTLGPLTCQSRGSPTAPSTRSA